MEEQNIREQEDEMMVSKAYQQLTSTSLRRPTKASADSLANHTSCTPSP